MHPMGFPRSLVGKESAHSAGDPGLIPVLGRSPEKEMATHSILHAGESHGQRSLSDYSLRGRKSRTQLRD